MSHSRGASRPASTDSVARWGASGGGSAGAVRADSVESEETLQYGSTAWASSVETKLGELEAENTMLRERLDALEDAFLHMNAAPAHHHHQQQHNNNNNNTAANNNTLSAADLGGSMAGVAGGGGGGVGGTPKAKSSRRKLHLRALSVLQKGWPLNAQYEPTLVRRMAGHLDGVYDVTCKSWHGTTVVGTASADNTARIWCNGVAVCSYQSHTGSVNSICSTSQSSHGMPLMCSASGDGTARMWRLPDGCLPHQADEDIFHDAQPQPGIEPEVPVLRDDVQVLRGHTGVVSSVAIFGSGGRGEDNVVTGSWDRSARVWDMESGTTYQVLTGHEADVTHVATHESKPLILTSSRDASFRIWDTRHTANDLVFQGHADTVTSALFADADTIVSGSDDRTVKFWDMRNMHAPTLVIRHNAGVNKLAVSPNGAILAVPLDNRYVQLYKMSGHRMCRFARRGGHQKMVSAVGWIDDASLLSSSFDSQVLEWSIVDPD